jgi:large subunit ribosomal protein L15
MPLQRRLPKRGFNNIFKKEHHVINISLFDKLAPGSVVDRTSLRALGIIKGPDLPIRLLGSGLINAPLNFKVQYATKSAQEKVTQAGGTVEIVSFPGQAKKGLALKGKVTRTAFFVTVPSENPTEEAPPEA